MSKVIKFKDKYYAGVKDKNNKGASTPLKNDLEKATKFEGAYEEDYKLDRILEKISRDLQRIGNYTFKDIISNLQVVDYKEEKENKTTNRVEIPKDSLNFHFAFEESNREYNPDVHFEYLDDMEGWSILGEVNNDIEKSLQQKLADIFREQGFTIDEGTFSDKSGGWVNIIQKESETKENEIVFGFDGEGEEVTDIKVFETEYEKSIKKQHSTKKITPNKEE